jgi:hypothetical protein
VRRLPVASKKVKSSNVARRLLVVCELDRFAALNRPQRSALLKSSLRRPYQLSWGQVNRLALSVFSIEDFNLEIWETPLQFPGRFQSTISIIELLLRLAVHNKGISTRWKTNTSPGNRRRRAHSLCALLAHMKTPISGINFLNEQDEWCSAMKSSDRG